VSDGAERIIAAPRLLLPGGNWSGPGAVAVAHGRITRVLDGPTPKADVSLSEGVLTSGLLDIHNNGAFGVDFAEAAPAGWRQALTGLAARGVTAVQPTVITAPLPALGEALERIAGATAAMAGHPVARVLGAHLEGPFLAPTRRGAHRADWLQDPSPAAIDALLGLPAARHVLRTVTLAPERDGGIAAVRRLASIGIRVAIGHSDASAEQVSAATTAGASLVTHLFNAMRPFAHRDPGVPGAALTDERLWCCLIIDGQHVHPLACRVAFQAAGKRLVAVTDSILVAGLPSGTSMTFGGLPVTLDSAGIGRRPDGTISGAGIVLDEGVRRMIGAGIEPALVLHAATEAPARALGV